MEKNFFDIDEELAHYLKLISLNIAYYRKKKGLTQEKLAEVVGISRTYLSKIEAPNLPASLSLNTLFAIAEALDVSLPEDEEFDTLNGLVMDTLGIIPEDGNRPQMDLFGLHIQVLEVKDRRVEWALVSKLATAVLEPEQIEKENN